jgi:hypothetical protein
MAQRSDNSIGSSDIARLLDLLNSSDAQSENVSDAQPEPGSQLAPPEPADAVSVPRISLSDLDQVDLAAESDETLENRFAAHIVHGMSKLKRT